MSKAPLFSFSCSWLAARGTWVRSRDGHRQTKHSQQSGGPRQTQILDRPFFQLIDGRASVIWVRPMSDRAMGQLISESARYAVISQRPPPRQAVQVTVIAYSAV